MRRNARLSFALAWTGVSAVVVLFGCDVDPKSYSSKIERPLGGDQASPSSPGGGDGSTNICQCALTFNSANGGSCNTCGQSATSPDGPCESEKDGCYADTLCMQAFGMLTQCPDSTDIRACIEGALESSALLAALEGCMCTNCHAKCLVASPIGCGYDADAGSGGAGGGP